MTPTPTPPTATPPPPGWATRRRVGGGTIWHERNLARWTAPPEADPLRGLFPAAIAGKPVIVEYEPDPDLRDTEQVPLLEEGGIDAFLRREALPYAPDAWYAHHSVKVGYEISSPATSTSPSPYARWRRSGLKYWRWSGKRRGYWGGLWGDGGIPWPARLGRRDERAPHLSYTVGRQRIRRGGVIVMITVTGGSDCLGRGRCTPMNSPGN